MRVIVEDRGDLIAIGNQKNSKEGNHQPGDLRLGHGNSIENFVKKSHKDGSTWVQSYSYGLRKIKLAPSID